MEREPEQTPLPRRHTMKKCSTSLVIREMQIKTYCTVRCHFTHIRMAIINKTGNNKCCRDCREKGTLVHCWWECKIVEPLWTIV